MDKKKKVILKQSLHKVCYGMKILAFCEAFRYLIMEDCNITFWCLVATYLLLFLVLHIWENRDYSVRMYPNPDDEEEYNSKHIKDLE